MPLDLHSNNYLHDKDEIINIEEYIDKLIEEDEKNG